MPKEEKNIRREEAEIKAAPKPISSTEYNLAATHQNKIPDKAREIREKIKRKECEKKVVLFIKDLAILIS